MKFHLLCATSVSACFELDNQAPYYAPQAFDVAVNGQSVLREVKTNVFSLFELTPDTAYEVTVAGDTVSFRTLAETACLNVMDFGAKADGVSDDTSALQSAVNVCPSGGRVLVPKGTYLMRPLVLKSDLTLHLQEGAVLLADPEEDHYPLLPGEPEDGVTGANIQVNSWEGTPALGRQSILSAYYSQNITVVGQGVIDGNASFDTWWKDVKARTIARPKLVFFNRCEHVVFHGILGRNSPAWNFHPFFCKDVGFYHIAVEAPADSHNTDGTDPESCDDVRYLGVRFSVGDDAIAIKSGKMYMGMKYKTPATHHLIRNCLMERAHGALTLGSEISGGIRDLTVSQCLFSHTDRGLRIKTRRGRGEQCVVDGVEFSNITMDNVMCPIVINMYYFCDPDGKTEYVWTKEALPVDERTPHMGSFTFRDMTCTDCEWAAAYCYGLPEMPIDSVTIENVSFTFKPDAQMGRPAMMSYIEDVSKLGLYFNCVKKVTLKNVTMEGQEGDRVITENVGEVEDR